jgi:hypothetical protein
MDHLMTVTVPGPFPFHRLRCVDEAKASELVPHLHVAGYGDAMTNGEYVEFTAFPNDAIHVVDFAGGNGYAHDHDAARVIALLPEGSPRV